MDLLLIAVAVVAVLAIAIWLIALAFGALSFMFVGAVLLFHLAAGQGFIGLAVYAACWVFMLPVMLIASLVIGFTSFKLDEQGDEAEQQRLRADMERQKQERHLRGAGGD